MTLSKACVPCHSRKVRCDAAETGMPCRRCVERNCVDRCVRVNRKPRARRQGIHQSASSVSRNQVLSPSESPLEGFSHLVPLHNSQNLTLIEAETVELQSGVQGQYDISPALTALPPSEDIITVSGPGKDLIEYPSSMHYFTVLGGLIGDTEIRRLTKAHPLMQGGDLGRRRDQTMEEAGRLPLDDIEFSFLEKKGAFKLPPKPFRDQLVKIYFESCYPYAPVFDRLEFAKWYERGNAPPLLMQAILACAAQFAPLELLKDCGFENRVAAQREFLNRGGLLYDLGYEKSQLRMLQGSLILGTVAFSIPLDKDFRYWLENAGRIAVNMGLHQNNISNDIDSQTRKLCRRIWWALYVRDISMSLTGLRNMRMFDSSDCVTSLLTEDDWDEPGSTTSHMHLFSPITRQQKLYMIEISKLSLIGEKCLIALKSRRTGSRKELADQFVTWRTSLPFIMRIQQYPDDVRDNIFPMILAATSCRFECILYRAVLKKSRDEEKTTTAWVAQRLQTAMFELDTLVGRAITDGMVKMLPLTFAGCVFTVLAIRLESSIEERDSPVNTFMTHAFIRRSVMFMREVRDFPTVERTLYLFERVLIQKGLAELLDQPGNSKETSNSTTVAPHSLKSRPDSIEISAKQHTSAHREPPSMGMMADPDMSFEEFLGFDFFNQLGVSGL